MTNNKKYYPWIVVALLWGVALLNYMDRQMLSTMKVCHDDRYYRTGISHELRTPDGGILVDIRPDEPVAGMIADRINRKWLIVAVSSSGRSSR